MIDKKVLDEFGIANNEFDGMALEGGQSMSIKYGNIVIKPVDDEQYSNFSLHYFSQLEPVGYRISKPIKSKSGKFIVNGYIATSFEPGKHDYSRIKDILWVSNKLHSDLKKFELESIPEFDNPWAKAQRVLWKTRKIPEHWDNKSKNLINKLLKELKPLDLAHQLIHSDLGGNVLFHDTLSPLVIDFSPTYAPHEYANALVVCDNIAWGDLELDAINLLKPYDLYKDVIKYAVAFRVVTIAFFEGCNYERVKTEWKDFKPIWDYVSD